MRPPERITVLRLVIIYSTPSVSKSGLLSRTYALNAGALTAALKAIYCILHRQLYIIASSMCAPKQKSRNVVISEPLFSDKSHHNTGAFQFAAVGGIEGTEEE